MRHILILLIVLTSCTSKTLKNADSTSNTLRPSEETVNNKSYENLNFAKSSNIIDTSKYIAIDSSMAIMIYPDSTWINKQQKEIGEDGWNEVVSDYDYYQSEAMDTLEKVGINIRFFHSEKQYYKFIKADNSFYCIDKSKMKDRWGLILFNKEKDPVWWSSTSIEDAIKDIYNK